MKLIEIEIIDEIKQNSNHVSVSKCKLTFKTGWFKTKEITKYAFPTNDFFTLSAFGKRYPVYCDKSGKTYSDKLSKQITNFIESNI